MSGSVSAVVHPQLQPVLDEPEASGEGPHGEGDRRAPAAHEEEDAGERGEEHDAAIRDEEDAAASQHRRRDDEDGQDGDDDGQLDAAHDGRP